MKSRNRFFGGLVGSGLALAFVFMLGSHATGQTCVQAPSGLVSWWPGDGHANDIAGTNHGTLQNGATFATGLAAQAFSLDGVDDFVLVPHNANLAFDNGQDFTIDAWINLQNPIPGNDDAIVTKWDVENGRRGISPNAYRFTLRRDTNQVRLDLISNGVSYILFSFSSVQVGQWTHVAAVREGSTGNIYINGVLDASAIMTAGSVANSDPLAIGGDFDTSLSPPVQPFNVFGGLIDEVEIYNRALTASEIQAIFAAGSAGKCKVTTVAIDIKPGSFPNSINLSSAGVVPVAILSSTTFDATQVDAATVTLAGAAVKLIGKGDKFACSAQDVNEDGLLDVVCHVVTAQFMVEPGDSVAVLEAKTFSGQAIRGQDSINIVP